MFNATEFKIALLRKGLTQKDLAKRIGMTEQTLTRKIKRGVFGTDEVVKIADVLEVRDPSSIFFAPEVTREVTKEGQRA